MAPKKNPLDDARKRLNEKLESIKEQSDYIRQVLNDTVENATKPARDLLVQRDRKKFFAKYSTVSQDLEKCLDFLLLLSDSVSSTNEEEQSGSSDEDDVAEGECEPSGHKTPRQCEGNRDSKEEENSPGTKAKDDQSKRKVQGVQESKKTVKEPFTSKEKASTNLKEHASLKDENNLVVRDENEKEISSESRNITVPSTKYHDHKSITNEEGLSTALKQKSVSSSIQGKSTSSREESSCKRTSPSSKSMKTSAVKEPTSKGSSPQSQQRQTEEPKEKAVLIPRKNPPGFQQAKSKAEVYSRVQRLGKRTPVASTFRDRKVATATHKATVQKVYLKPYPLADGTSLKVIVTEVISPWELWLQPINTEFDLLMEKMCMEFATAARGGYKGGLSTPPSVGDFCCARFTEDDTWYRVQVISISQSDDTDVQQVMDIRGRYLSSSSTTSTGSLDDLSGVTVEVLCVDDGNREKLPLSRLRPLPDAFTVLPCQAVCCALSGIQPIRSPEKTQKSNSVWDGPAINWLKNKVFGNTLIAYLSTTKGPSGSLLIAELYLPSAAKSKGSGNPDTLPGLQFSISHQMVNAGMAKLVQQTTPCDSPDLSPNSMSSEGYKETRQSLAGVSEGVAKPEEGVSTQQHSVSGEPDTLRKSVTQFSMDKGDTIILPNDSEKTQIVANLIHDNSTMLPADQPLQPSGSSVLIASYEQKTWEIDGTMRQAPDGSSFSEIPPQGLEMPQVQMCLRVMMAEVTTPSEFYVHLITPEAGLLDILMDELQQYYSGPDSNVPMDYQLEIGEFCCAKFSEDGRWYRANVCDVRITSEGRDSDDMFEPVREMQVKAEIQVFYIDFGNIEWVDMSDTRPLLARFMMVPGFAVKCRLAGVQPLECQDENLEKNAPPITSDSSKSSTEEATPFRQSTSEESPQKAPAQFKVVEKPATFTSPRKRTRGKTKMRPKVVNDESVIIRAAGDESYDSDLSETSLLLELPEKQGLDTRLVGDNSSGDGGEALPEKYLTPSPDKALPPPLAVLGEDRNRKWSHAATELFKGLTGDDKSLMGLMVPWDPQVYSQVFCSMAPVYSPRAVGVTYRRPTLVLELYDTTEDEDIHINQVLIDTGLAEPCEENLQVDLTPTDNGTDEETTKKVKVTLSELEKAAERISGTGSPLLSDSGDSDDEAYQRWNPMMEDYISSRNSYRTDVDDAEVAILGYKSRDLKVCRFFKSKTSTCWRGDNCEFLHLKEGEQPKFEVQAYCNNISSSVELPEVGTWVAVRVTAIMNPGHFWIQFPCGSESIEKKIIEARSGALIAADPNEEQEDLDAMMKRMSNFYSRNLFRESGAILPAPGELAVVHCDEEDNIWYRAQVIDFKEDLIQVSLVDYGNTAWVPEKFLKRMLPQFLHLPFQAIECLLANAEPAGDDGRWSKEAGEKFEELTADKVLIAQVLSSSDATNMLFLDLYDTSEDEVHINLEMVRLGHARRTKVVLEGPREPSENGPEEIITPG
ncbi:uncharacterized protein LOC5507515 isoform X2 [Nematostella vectensis]|uniref:uncharacterized protein LOC5507515 isoform X2 n=1 Tax=Nematostella vectensis TaxID=45351 RepID=UPI0020772C93|nr:uncharacterized protein LOC5507515 isoform X2 [Nematostella vectensis]